MLTITHVSHGGVVAKHGHHAVDSRNARAWHDCRRLLIDANLTLRNRNGTWTKPWCRGIIHVIVPWKLSQNLDASVIIHLIEHVALLLATTLEIRSSDTAFKPTKVLFVTHSLGIRPISLL